LEERDVRPRVIRINKAQGKGRAEREESLMRSKGLQGALALLRLGSAVARLDVV
jgi:hypothetical protein